MNKQFFIKQIFFYFMLFKRLGIPVDVIYLIIEENIPYGPVLKNLLDLGECIKREYKLSMRLNSSHFEKTWSMDTKDIYNIKQNNNKTFPFIKDNHGTIYMNSDVINIECGCDLCTFNIDYPRYLYLIKHVNNPQRGDNSKIFRHWMLFLYYTLLTAKDTKLFGSYYVDCYNYMITEQNSYGFCYIFNKNNIIKSDDYNAHPIIGKDKGKWLQLKKIWVNNLLMK